MILQIAGIPGTWTPSTLRNFLECYARIYSARIDYDPITQKSKNVGFVEVERKLDAERLIEIFNEKILSTGQVLKVAVYGIGGMA